MKIVITESQLRQLTEIYDPEKLYKKSYIVNVLKKANSRHRWKLQTRHNSKNIIG